MKELSGLSRNYYYVENDEDELKPQVELIVIVSEPHWRLGAAELIKERMSETYRMVMNRKGVAMMMKDLIEIDKDLEKMEQRLKPLKKEADGA